jgi:membrane protein
MKQFNLSAAKKVISMLTQTVRNASEKRLFQMSASLAYYAMFSIGPLLVMTFGLAGIAFGHESVRQQLDQQLQGLFGRDAAGTLDSMMTSRHYTGTTLTTVAGLIALVFGAAGVFSQLQYSMNAIWEVKARPNQGIWNWVRKRFLSLAMVLGTGFLLLISLVLTTMLAAIAGRWSSGVTLPEMFVHGLNAGISFVVIAALFAMIYKFLPDVVIPFSKVWGGAIGTALLFEGGKYLLSFYIGREGFTSSYGAAGAVIAILLWVYYGSILLFLGAEFTRVFVTQTDGLPKVSTHAVRVVTHETSRKVRAHTATKLAA